MHWRVNVLNVFCLGWLGMVKTQKSQLCIKKMQKLLNWQKSLKSQKLQNANLNSVRKKHKFAKCLSQLGMEKT